MKKFMGKTMAKMNENRRNGRRALKGFTLVEIIVVLVILAILAAAMIPALTGYIDKAQERTAIAEARNVLTAAQTLASEEYGLHGKNNLGDNGTAWFATEANNKAVLELADIPEGGVLGTVTTDGKAKIKTLEYTTKTEIAVYYNGTEFFTSTGNNATDAMTKAKAKVPATPATPASGGN